MTKEELLYRCKLLKYLTSDIDDQIHTRSIDENVIEKNLKTCYNEPNIDNEVSGYERK